VTHFAFCNLHFSFCNFHFARTSWTAWLKRWAPRSPSNRAAPTALRRGNKNPTRHRRPSAGAAMIGTYKRSHHNKFRFLPSPPSPPRNDASLSR